MVDEQNPATVGMVPKHFSNEWEIYIYLLQYINYCFARLFSLLVGGWTNPFEKYARQIGNILQIGVKRTKTVFESTT